MDTITKKLADFALNLKFEDIPSDAVEAAKRFIFDSLGCALGGLKQSDPAIYKRVVGFLGSKPHATVFGTAEKLSLVDATLINSLLVRVMDYNDIYWNQDPSHPSDLIPVAFSIGEHEGLDGKAVLSAVVVAYELEMRLCDFAVPGIRERGWHHATLTQLASPLTAARLLGLSAEEAVNAAGIAGSCHCTLGAVTAGKLTMMKNTVDPVASASGVEAALLAREGYTGPEHVIDGKEGLMQVLGDGWDEQSLISGLGEDFKITGCSMKSYPTEALTHSPITALIDIIKKENIMPDEVEKVRVFTVARAADILSDPSKYNPKSKETADHSLPYCLAAAIAYGRVTPVEFSQERINDQAVRKIINRIKVEVDPGFESIFPKKQPARVIVETAAGKSYESYVEYPKGHPKNPMKRDDLVEKFASLASPELEKARVEGIYELVNRFEQQETLDRIIQAIQIK